MQRLDLYLASHGHTRSYASKLIASGRVQVNGITILKPSHPVSEQDQVRYADFEPVEIAIRPERIPLDIVYQDEDLLVVDKPRGMVVHPSKGHEDHTLVNALLAHCPLSSIGGELRPGIVHRLDKDTSGLLIVAKNDFTHTALSGMMERKEIHREYLALVHGEVRNAATVETWFGRDRNNRLKMAVTEAGRGRMAITKYEPVEAYRKFTLLRVELITGRTHQIRVHMAYIGHPVAGDPVYGRKDDLSRFGFGQVLHSDFVSFTHPRTGRTLCIRSSLPKDFEQALETARSC